MKWLAKGITTLSAKAENILRQEPALTVFQHNSSACQCHTTATVNGKVFFALITLIRSSKISLAIWMLEDDPWPPAL